ncbi:UDP-galactopyranose mutase, partial [Bifidobacterium adolescentis]
EADKALYARYEELAKAEPRTVFGGRLGTYKYYDMHNVIDTALTAYEQQVEPLLKK